MINEADKYTLADTRKNPDHSNCTKCFKLIDYAYITTGESLCEQCYLKAVDERAKEIEKRKKEVGNISTTNFVDFVEKEDLWNYMKQKDL